MSDCIPRDGHCWHEVPIYYTGTDEPFEAVCCHCGSTYASVTKPDVPLGHGQYYPKPMRDVLDWTRSPDCWCRRKRNEL